MTVIEWINIFVILIGVPIIAKRVSVIYRLLNIIEILEADIRENIKPDLKDLRDRLTMVEDKIEILWKEK